jgi:hypothetical protein
MKVLVDRMGVDQPYVKAATVASGPDKGKERVFVGSNDFHGPNGKTASIDRSNDGTHFTTVRLESRPTSGQDGPPGRPAIHPDRTVYAVYHSWRTFDPNTKNRRRHRRRARRQLGQRRAASFGALKSLTPCRKARRQNSLSTSTTFWASSALAAL